MSGELTTRHGHDFSVGHWGEMSGISYKHKRQDIDPSSLNLFIMPLEGGVEEAGPRGAMEVIVNEVGV